MKILSIVGARPQFIKASQIFKRLSKDVKHVLVHTGQHYDNLLSDIFFKDLKIPEPEYNLGVGSGSHAFQTSKMMVEIESVVNSERPDLVLVYGDTNSTLAGALVSSKLRIKTAHLEAGLRSFNRSMPEEINRLLTDHCSSILFCPTKVALSNLEKEGITKEVYLTGDVMYDALMEYLPLAKTKSKILENLDIETDFILLTLHRPQNVDDSFILLNILNSVSASGKDIIWPIHPRSKNTLVKNQLVKKVPSNIKIIDPVGYIDMLSLEYHSSKIATDSGGVQKEAYILEKPCITIRPDTEWVETIDDGWNVLVDTDSKKIKEEIINFNPKNKPNIDYGGGQASSNVCNLIEELLVK